jgi:hypothetical protein
MSTGKGTSSSILDVSGLNDEVTHLGSARARAAAQ